MPCFGQTNHSGTLFWPSSFRSQQSGFSNNSFGKFATLLVSPFGLVLFLTIFLQKSEDSFQLVFFQKDQQVSRNSPFARTQNLHSNRANLDFNTLLMFHFFGIDLVALQLVISLLFQLMQFGSIGQRRIFQWAIANQPGHQRGAALNLQIVIAIQVLQGEKDISKAID